MAEIEGQIRTFNRTEGGLRIRGKFRKQSQPNQPLVTVITVVRNGGHLLERTINSVLNQTYGNIEYIIVDGASTDGTLELIKRYDDQIAYWISEPDRGLYDAMNKGICLASGEWINFMNVGDAYFAQDTVDYVASQMDEYVDLIYGQCQMIFSADFSVIWKTGNMKDLWKGMIFRHQSLFTRTAICRIQMFDLSYRISGDFAFIYSCYQNRYHFRDLNLVVSSVVLGGLSDQYLDYGLQENRRAVIKYEKSLTVHLYYGYMISLLKIKNIIKRFFPEVLINWVRTLKYK